MIARPRPAHSLILSCFLLFTLGSGASVVGTSTAAPSITPERIVQLPASERGPWMVYLERSQRQMAADRATLAAERSGLATLPAVPLEGPGTRLMPLDRDPAFYASPEARHTADVIVSFQTPAGGWGKNQDYSGAPRQPGQAYVPNNISHFLDDKDFDRARDPDWNYVGTLDNDATTTQLRFLARVQAAAPDPSGDRYRESFLRGIAYLLAAQFPNGGWPQVWPLEGGYHDAITFNDNAVTQANEVLTSAAQGTGDYAFVPAKIRREARTAAAKALEIILKTQIVVAGKKTVWAQQHDALTLEPVSGRNYEPAALSSGESAHLLEYLMAIDHPSPQVKSAIEAGIDWLRSAAIYGYTWTGGRTTPGGRHLEPQPGAGPIWARYYSLQTGKPVFGDRDRSIHDNVADLTPERRNGYAWYSDAPKSALETYATWKRNH
jgi:PelA/Pel-15E family pectate lyase